MVFANVEADPLLSDNFVFLDFSFSNGSDSQSIWLTACQSISQSAVVGRSVVGQTVFTALGPSGCRPAYACPSAVASELVLCPLLPLWLLPSLLTAMSLPTMVMRSADTSCRGLDFDSHHLLVRFRVLASIFFHGLAGPLPSILPPSFKPEITKALF